MTKLRVLHLEDNLNDTVFVRQALLEGGFEVDFSHATSQSEFCLFLHEQEPDVILLDQGVPGFSSLSALEMASQVNPATPCVVVSGSSNFSQIASILEKGAADYVPKSELWQLPAVVRRVRTHSPAVVKQKSAPSSKKLLDTVQELSLARSIAQITEIVRKAARDLSGADGATFVLRDGDLCYYADEDAISPLWKGQRFPMETCISGWVMLHRQSTVIPDIYVDPRIPAQAYRPTFVKSLVMVPIRCIQPIGAIGTYWASAHQPTADQVEMLEALANTTSVAMENVQLYEQLEQRVSDRTAQLDVANRELEAFSYSVSHDLRAPLRGIVSYSNMLERRQDSLDDIGKTALQRIQAEAQKMGNLIEDLLLLSKYSTLPMRPKPVNLSLLARQIAADFPGVELRFQDNLQAEGDPGLLRVLLDNLLGNARKYSAKRKNPWIELGIQALSDGDSAFYVRDNGAGFDMRFAQNLFAPFQRMHSQEEFAGTGVGLATVQRIVHRHGGRIWAEAAINQGATFYFTLTCTARS